MEQLLRGGPKQCPRPCSECDPGHHWLEVCPNPDDLDDEDCQHEAYKTHGLLAWNECKHCEAWEQGNWDSEDEDGW